MTKFGDLSTEKNNLISEQMSRVRVIRGMNKLLISHLSLLPISGFEILRHTSSEEERKKGGRLFNSNRFFFYFTDKSNDACCTKPQSCQQEQDKLGLALYTGVK